MKNGDIALYRPGTVNMTLVRGCNRKCDFCGTRGISEERVDISAADFLSVLNLIVSGHREYKRWTPRLVFGGDGEPTLHSDFMYLMSMAKGVLKIGQKGKAVKHVQLITNGYLFRKWWEQGQRIAADNMDLLMQIVDDIIVDDYDKLWRKSLDNGTFNWIGSLPSYAEFVVYRKGVPWNYDGKGKRFMLVPNPAESQNLVTRHWHNFCGAGMDPSKSSFPREKGCAQPFRKMEFDVYGRIRLCCMDIRCNTTQLQAFDYDSMDDAWRNPVFEAYRRVLLDEGRKACSPCRICNMYNVRPGLVPDACGLKRLPKPTIEDYELVQGHEPSVTVVKREWED